MSVHLIDNVRWRSAPAHEFVQCHWDGNHIVFHRPSGLTHVLNTAMFHLLDVVLREPSDISTAMDRLADLCEGHVSALTRDQMTDSLLHLEHLGLVRRE